MQKLLQKLFNKHTIIACTNVLALMAMIGSVNATCGWIHHQPKVPENDAQRNIGNFNVGENFKQYC